MMQYRKTILVRGHAAIRRRQLEAARAGEQGVLVTTVANLAARLAGGFSQPVDGDSLRQAVSQVLPQADLGELASIADLPGMAMAVAQSLQRAWLAGIDLQAGQHPRVQALASVERAALQLLPAGMLPVTELVRRALANLEHASAITGPVEIHGFSHLEAVYLRLIDGLAQQVPVSWHGREGFSSPFSSAVRIVSLPAATPDLHAVSAGTAFNEVQEAMRWVRDLLVRGVPAADIAISAASTQEYDPFILAARQAAGFPLHFAHGLPVSVTHPGQTAAALADVLVRGLSQTRMRRLNSHLAAEGGLFQQLPDGWLQVLPADAPLDRAADWGRLIRQLEPSDWPDAQDHAPLLGQIVSLLQRGIPAAAEIGAELLPADALAVWQRALLRGPASAVDQTLEQLRVKDPTEPTNSVAWLPAAELQAAPRPYARLLGLNSGRWPRSGGEDSLLPDHVIPSRVLNPVTVTEQDRLSFQLILASTEKEVVLSWSRRGSEGRRLPISALVPPEVPVRSAYRHDVPDHAFSDADRLLARPEEFAATPHATAALGTWQSWSQPELTPHDGLVAADHPLIVQSTDRRMSATSLKLLLRHPAGYVWRYALKLQAPEGGRSELQLTPMAYGSLVHELVEESIQLLGADEGLLAAEPSRISQAVQQASDTVAARWLVLHSTPPRQLWERHVEEARRSIEAAFTANDFGPGTAYAEVPFGGNWSHKERQRPWDHQLEVRIPGTQLTLGGYIDQLNISADGKRVQVIDYKSGGPPKSQADYVLDGGNELQRSIYAYAVRSLLGDDVQVQPSLVYLRGGTVLTLTDPEATLEKLTGYATEAVITLLAGAAIPGPGAGEPFDDLRLALPAYFQKYLDRKGEAIRELLPLHTELWSQP